jgi:hypothetical protein
MAAVPLIHTGGRAARRYRDTRVQMAAGSLCGTSAAETAVRGILNDFINWRGRTRRGAARVRAALREGRYVRRNARSRTQISWLGGGGIGGRVVD